MILYFSIPDKFDRLYNLFGNISIGFFTGFIIMLFGNIKNRELKYDDFILDFHNAFLKGIVNHKNQYDKFMKGSVYNTNKLHYLFFDALNILSEIRRAAFWNNIDIQWWSNEFISNNMNSIYKEAVKIEKELDGKNYNINKSKFHELYSKQLNDIEYVLSFFESKLESRNNKVSEDKKKLENGIL